MQGDILTIIDSMMLVLNLAGRIFELWKRVML